MSHLSKFATLLRITQLSTPPYVYFRSCSSSRSIRSFHSPYSHRARTTIMDSLRFGVMPLPCFLYNNKFIYMCKERKNGVAFRGTSVVSALSYQKFVDFALDETIRRTHLNPSPLQETFNSIQATDGKTGIKFQASEASKIRLMRNMYINGDDSLQVLDLAIFPKVEYDLPIFCANFFSTSAMSIIVLDLNPLYDIICHRVYRDKYYKHLMPLGTKYSELLPWGGKITSESLRFFSPIVIWTKFTSSQRMHDILFAAFKDYFKAWLDLMDEAKEETDTSQIMLNKEAQHRYLTWRAEKDPGHQLLKKLIGEAKATDVLQCFLFDGVNELGSKKFLDYFPEYKLEDGTVNKNRSVIGKSFENRPWDIKGEFVINRLH